MFVPHTVDKTEQVFKIKNIYVNWDVFSTDNYSYFQGRGYFWQYEMR